MSALAFDRDQLLESGDRPAFWSIWALVCRRLPTAKRGRPERSLRYEGSYVTQPAPVCIEVYGYRRRRWGGTRGRSREPPRCTRGAKRRWRPAGPHSRPPTNSLRTSIWRCVNSQTGSIPLTWVDAVRGEGSPRRPARADLAGCSPPALFLGTLPFLFFKISTLPFLGYQAKNIHFANKKLVAYCKANKQAAVATIKQVTIANIIVKMLIKNH